MKFKKGDKVIVTHKGNLNTCWVRGMDKTIGNEYTITMISSNEAEIELNGGYWYPIETLMKSGSSIIETLEIF